MSAVLAVEQHAPRVEKLRLKGERAARARTMDVLDPYTNTRIGTVPMASVDDVRDAFEYAANYHSTLTRYERSQAAALSRTISTPGNWAIRAASAFASTECGR